MLTMCQTMSEVLDTMLDTNGGVQRKQKNLGNRPSIGKQDRDVFNVQQDRDV